MPAAPFKDARVISHWKKVSSNKTNNSWIVNFDVMHTSTRPERFVRELLTPLRGHRQTRGCVASIGPMPTPTGPSSWSWSERGAASGGTSSTWSGASRDQPRSPRPCSTSCSLKEKAHGAHSNHIYLTLSTWAQPHCRCLPHTTVHASYYVAWRILLDDWRIFKEGGPRQTLHFRDRAFLPASVQWASFNHGHVHVRVCARVCASNETETFLRGRVKKAGGGIGVRKRSYGSLSMYVYVRKKQAYQQQSLYWEGGRRSNEIWERE